MQKPRILKRYCKFCRKHTDQKIVLIGSGHGRGSLKKGGKVRARMRGRWRGMGSLGRYSKPAMSSYKRKTKSTKKTNMMYTCQVCKKSLIQNKGTRTGKVALKKEGEE